MRVDGKPLCDLCGADNLITPAVYDAKLPYGPWADLCQTCFTALGCKLGLGRGSEIAPTEVGSEIAPTEVGSEIAVENDSTPDATKITPQA